MNGSEGRATLSSIPKKRFPASGRVSMETTTRRQPGQPAGPADPAGSTVFL